MNQALWIFRKDVRHLRIQIAITLALQFGFTIFDILSSPVAIPETSRINALALWSSVFLPLSWWYLLALVVHEEALPGTRQFWVTRPYSWKSLLAAKLLFALAFINAPVFLSDCAILGAQGFPVLHSIPALLVRQIPFSLLFIFPALSLAALTTGIPQLLLAVFLIVVGWLLEATIFSSGHTNIGIHVGSSNWVGDWIGIAAFLAIVLAVLCWEYATRQTKQVRALFGLVILFTPFAASLPLNRITRPTVVNRRVPRPLDTSAIHLAYGSAPKYLVPNANWIQINLPVDVTGLPPQSTVEGGTTTIRYRTSNGSAFADLKLGSNIGKHPDGYWQMIAMEPQEFEHLRSQPITLRSSFDLTLVSAKPVVQIPARDGALARVPDVGECSLETRAFLTPPGLICRAGVWKPQRTEVRVTAENVPTTAVYTGDNFNDPYPLMIGLSPVSKWFLPLTSNDVAKSQLLGIMKNPASQIVFVPQYPLGTFQRTLDIQNVRLDDIPSRPEASR